MHGVLIIFLLSWLFKITNNYYITSCALFNIVILGGRFIALEWKWFWHISWMCIPNVEVGSYYFPSFPFWTCWKINWYHMVYKSQPDLFPSHHLINQCFALFFVVMIICLMWGYSFLQWVHGWYQQYSQLGPRG